MSEGVEPVSGSESTPGNRILPFRSWIATELIEQGVLPVLFSQVFFLVLLGLYDLSLLIPGLVLCASSDLVLFFSLRKRTQTVAEELEKSVHSIIVATWKMAEKQERQEIMPSPIQEFEQLRTSFEQMSRQLETSYSNLERRVTAAVQSAITATRQQELLLSRQAKQAALGEMLGNIAYQWRQPLNSLGLIIQNFRDVAESGEVNQEFLETCKKQGMTTIHSLSQMLDDFRTFYKTDDAEPRFFMVGEQIRKTLSFIDGMLKMRGIRLELDIASDIELLGFPNAFSQVLLNLLTNASDAIVERMPENPVIRVFVTMEHGITVVKVIDNGGGIPQEVMPRLFEPYFTTRPPGKGAGLGLHITRAILEKSFKGRITATNEGAGACFKIQIPAPPGEAETRA